LDCDLRSRQRRDSFDSIEQFETEVDYDWVSVYDGVDTEAESLSGQLRGEMSTLYHRHFVSSGESLTVDFKSDASVNAGGFELSYVCGNGAG
jgi:hypothetical protein